MQSYKIGVVSYLNSKPFLHGLHQAGFDKSHQLVVESPSNIARMLLRGEIDLGLVPVFILHKMSSYHIVSDYCIGADGAVSSVCLFSDTAIENCNTIILDNESRTSAALTKALMKNHFKLSPNFVQSYDSYENDLIEGTAGLVIGDRALRLNGKYKYVYDLGKEWKKFTGLPFVFAAWISNKKVDEEFVKQFNDACRNGVAARNTVAEESRTDYQGIDIKHYFNYCISYELDERKRKGLELFLNYSREL